MHYHSKEQFLNEACDIWKSEKVELARAQPGLVRLQILVARSTCGMKWALSLPLDQYVGDHFE